MDSFHGAVVSSVVQWPALHECQKCVIVAPKDMNLVMEFDGWENLKTVLTAIGYSVIDRSEESLQFGG